MAGGNNASQQWLQHVPKLTALIEESIPLFNTSLEAIRSLELAVVDCAELELNPDTDFGVKFAACQSFLRNDILRARTVERAFVAFNAEVMPLSSIYTQRERNSELGDHLQSNLTLQHEKSLQLVRLTRQQEEIFKDSFGLNEQPPLRTFRDKNIKELAQIYHELKKVFLELGRLVAENKARIYYRKNMIVSQLPPPSAALRASRSPPQLARPLFPSPDVQADPELVSLDEELERRFITEPLDEEGDDADSEFSHGEYSEGDQNGDVYGWGQAEDEPVILGPDPLAQSLWRSAEDEDEDEADDGAADHRLRRPLQRMKLPPLRPGESFRRLSSTSEGDEENASERRPRASIPPLPVDPNEVIAEPGPVRLRGGEKV